MKAFGYMLNDFEAEEPNQLREATLYLSLTEIEILIGFLQDVKSQFASSNPTQGQSHIHLRDEWKGWNSSMVDVVVVYDGPS